MILLSIEINCLRGIKNLQLNFSGKNTVIYGDNGTGKSGVIDALDFLIKGDITRLSGVGSKNLTLGKHGKYVTEDIGQAWVKAIVKLPNRTEDIEIKRFLNNPNVLVCDSKYQADFEEISKLAELQAHYLSRREILQFINSTDQERAKNIEKLLNLYSLEKNRSALQKAKKAIEDELKASQAQEKTYISKISDKLGVAQKLWLDAINEIRFQLGAIPITELNESSIASNISITKTTIPKTEVTTLIQKIEDIYNSFCVGVNSLVSQIKETKLIYEKVLLFKEYEEQVNSIILYEQGQKLLTSNSCPLCGQEIESKERLLSTLQEKIDKLKETKKIFTDYQNSIKQLQQTLVTVKRQLVAIDFDKLSNYIDGQKLQNILTDITNLYSTIENGNFSSEIAQDFLVHEHENTIKTDYIDELCKISAGMAIDQKEISYKNLIDINANYSLLVQLQQKIALLIQHANRATVLFNAYVASQTNALNEMYNSIQDRFSQLYKTIHESDEGAFSSAFNRKAASLELQVKFQDGNMYPPNAVHSEGHQDSMGICLFFALSEKISNSRLNLILLDDVVMSIDIDHRKNFCKLLKEQFPHKQFIITTHDYIWRKELETQGVVAKKNVIHFKAWDIKHGPYVEIGSNIWEAINSHLIKGEKGEAIGLMRYYMEEFFSDICAKYKLKVPYSTSGRWSLEDVLSPVNTHYRQAIRKAKESAISFKKPVDKIEAYEKLYIAAFDNLQVERWAINPSTHFTVWAQSLSIDELKSTCSAVKEFCEQFECPNCKSLITINSDMNLVPQNICCDCGDYSFSCVKKK